MTDVDPLIIELWSQRRALQWDRMTVCRKLGWSGSERLKEYEEGRVSPTMKTIREWATVLGVDVLIGFGSEDA
jgi:transcriptional regulator with XRE-family HTH domain